MLRDRLRQTRTAGGVSPLPIILRPRADTAPQLRSVAPAAFVTRDRQRVFGHGTFTSGGQHVAPGGFHAQSAPGAWALATGQAAGERHDPGAGNSIECPTPLKPV